jgi:hypothetical protein
MYIGAYVYSMNYVYEGGRDMHVRRGKGGRERSKWDGAV